MTSSRMMARTSRKEIRIKIRDLKRNRTRSKRGVSSSKGAGETRRMMTRPRGSCFPLSKLCNQIGSSLPTYFHRYLV
jgi:hypothetical protein